MSRALDLVFCALLHRLSPLKFRAAIAGPVVISRSTSLYSS
jgi:hypothetical protein